MATTGTCVVMAGGKSKEYTVEPTMPVEEFMKMVVEHFQQNLEKTEFLLQNSTHLMTTIDPKTSTLSDTGIIFDEDVRNIIVLLAKTCETKKYEKKYELNNEEEEEEKKVQKFKGLINQSNTCYLNCFLQSLFMIPEIKNRVIKWNIKQDDLCILSQLQKLFIRMEIAKENAVSTKEFTNSFKWFIKHMEDHQDVHEFLAALLDGIQEASKKYELSDIVTEFYSGKLRECLKCAGCNAVKYKDVPFLDIQLPVKNMKGELYECIEDILNDYTSSEWLTGSDQLFCETCNVKCDTEKGQVFKTLPYLLNLSLSRFDYDCTKMRVVKINGRITFPLQLTITDMENNVFQYELMSVIVHKGTPSSGHYYAHIKDVQDNSWYLFDDRKVYSIGIDELERAFGVGVTTGYVFVYRMIDKSKNEMPIKKEEFSEDLKKLANTQSASREALYVFRVHLKRHEKITLLKKFLSFGFNTLDDLKRRVISHVNVMMPEIDTDDSSMALYNYESGEIEKYIEKQSFSIFLSDWMESDGDTIHILFEANNDRPVEEEEIYIPLRRPLSLPEFSLNHNESTKKKEYSYIDDDSSIYMKNKYKSSFYINEDYLRNYIFHGQVVLDADLLKFNSLARTFIHLCEYEINVNNMTTNELKIYIKKLIKQFKTRKNKGLIKINYCSEKQAATIYN